ncbi:hypothetical protein ID866_4800 [Astraeus odoratus]|nr:hypothetical protein ID866_4800 [Astraeus odoratus]
MQNGRHGQGIRDRQSSEMGSEAITERGWIPYWSAKRHLTCGNPSPRSVFSAKLFPWRGSAPGKLKTANAALVLCLNIDVDPPDIIKTNPCAVLECWVDPHTLPSHKALEAIGTNLQHQFEGLSLKIPYKPILDPSYEDLRRFCMTLRKQAKDETVCFYYNGHGVPKPTPSGELWCFNRNYTQYIPVSLMELQSWLGSPGVYIWDCSAAGNLLTNFNNFAERRDQEVFTTRGGYPDGMQPYMNSLQLAACLAHEQLPSCPELPADIFTSCLTSPIDIALRYFIMTHQLPSNITPDMVMQLPGDLKDRRTPLGELNWIFTAITDTIAWTTFPRGLFTRLYRSDLLIASLFRNFLLAERIMKNYHCTPHTYPPLPPTNTHPLWAAWDLAVDTCLRQLPDLLAKAPAAGAGPSNAAPQTVSRTGRVGQPGSRSAQSSSQTEKPYQYIPSRFFTDQLTAFEVWISRGGSALTKRGPMSLPMQNGGTGYEGMDAPVANGHANGREHGPNSSHSDDLVPRKPPDQLPIVLQVLLSQPHRLRALILLSQFVDLGPWAVNLVLTIGIFPYISKLLQAAGQDLRPVLIFIWARIMAVDPSVQVDLHNTGGFKYFANVLALTDDQPQHALPNSSEHKAMCAFILAAVARDYYNGQMACWRERVFDSCFDKLDEGDFLLRQWSALCIAQIWDANDEIKVYGVDRGTQDKLILLLSDDSPEVRAAAMYALGTFMGASGSADFDKHGGRGSGTQYQLEERIHFRMEVAVVTGATVAAKDDASPMVRKELLVLISCLVKEWRGYFVVCAWIYWEEDRKWRTEMSTQPREEEITAQAMGEWLESFGDDEAAREENRVLLSSFFTIFVALLELTADPYHEVATNAQTVTDYIVALLLASPFYRLDCTSLDSPPIPVDARGGLSASVHSRVPSLQSSPLLQHATPAIASRPGIARSENVTSALSSSVTSTLRRTSSFANALRSLAGGITFPSMDEGRAPSSPLPGPLTPLRADLAQSRPPSPNLNLALYASPYSRPQTPMKGMSSQPPSPIEYKVQPDYTPLNVMEALMEEDMVRLRARRRTGVHGRRTTPGLDGPSGDLNSPCGSTFSMDSGGSNVPLGCGTGNGLRDVLPLKSSFFDWCCEYFKEPQMRQAEADEPGSVQYNYQVWRQQRNEQIITETSSQALDAERSRWDRPVASLQVNGIPLSMTLHSYDPHLVVANDTDMISVWDWSQRKRLNYFCNGNPRGTSITSLHIINQDVGGIIMTGSADGIVRLYRNYDATLDQGPLQMVSSFRGLNDLINVRRGSGIIMEWKQSGGSLLVGGDSRIIRVWDAHTELHVLNLETNSESPVTSIVSEHGSTSTFIAAFADGVVKVFDRRLEEEDAVVGIYEGHHSWVQNVRYHPRFSGQFLSASLAGEVRLWDIRGSNRPVQALDLHPSGLSTFDVHPQAGVFATTSALTPTNWRHQRFMLHSILDPNPLSSLMLSTGLSVYPQRQPSPYIPRSTSFSFHPVEMLYAAGQPDGTVKLMGCKLPLEPLKAVTPMSNNPTVLLAAGSNARGQLGIGSTNDAHTFTPCRFAGYGFQLPPNTTRIVGLASGANHTIIVLQSQDGEIQLWGAGDGSKGQLGPKHAGTKDSTFRPLAISLSDILQEKELTYKIRLVAAAWETTYIVFSCPGKSDLLVSMGSNDFGALGVGANTSTSGKPYIVDLTTTLDDRMDATHLRTVTIKSMCAGPRHVVIELQTRMADEAASSLVLVGWGASRQGQLGQKTKMPFTNRPIVIPIDIVGDPLRCCALGNEHTVILHQSGSISALGSNRKGQLEGLSSLKLQIQSVGCTWNGTYIHVREGNQDTLFATGSNTKGQLGRCDTSASISGTLSPVRLSTMPWPTRIVMLACGSEHVLVLTSPSRDEENVASNSVWGWGWNEHGNLGLELSEDVPLPVQLWPREGANATGKVVGVWAACGTSWLALSSPCI